MNAGHPRDERALVTTRKGCLLAVLIALVVALFMLGALDAFLRAFYTSSTGFTFTRPRPEHVSAQTQLDRAFPGASIQGPDRAPVSEKDPVRITIDVDLPLSQDAATSIASALRALNRDLDLGRGSGELWAVMTLVDGEQRFEMVVPRVAADDLRRMSTLVELGAVGTELRGSELVVTFACNAHDAECIERAGDRGMAALEQLDRFAAESEEFAQRSAAVRLELRGACGGESVESSVVVESLHREREAALATARVAFDAWAHAFEPISAGGAPDGCLVMGTLQARTSPDEVRVRLERLPAGEPTTGDDAALERLLEGLGAIERDGVEISVVVRPGESLIPVP